MYSTHVPDVLLRSAVVVPRVKSHAVNPIFEETMEYFLPHSHLASHRIEAGHSVHSVHIHSCNI
jgi:hypothetical protein